LEKGAIGGEKNLGELTGKKGRRVQGAIFGSLEKERWSRGDDESQKGELLINLTHLRRRKAFQGSR